MKNRTKSIIISSSIAITTSVLGCVEHDWSMTICLIVSVAFVFLVSSFPYND